LLLLLLLLLFSFIKLFLLFSPLGWFFFPYSFLAFFLLFFFPALLFSLSFIFYIYRLTLFISQFYCTSSALKA
ncbi:hypothetical protein DU61_02735, partial [Methanosarcina mazei]